jgi:hypothetical protein
MKPSNNETLPAIPAEVKKDTNDAMSYAESIIAIRKIENQPAFDKSAYMLIEIKVRYKALEALRKSMTDPLDASKKAIIEFFSKPLDLLKQAEGNIKVAIQQFNAEQERLRKIEEDKLREKQEKEAEKLRIKIAEAKKAGETEKVEKLIEKKAVVTQTVISVAPKFTPAAGITIKKIWKFRIANLLLVPRDYLMIDEVKIGSVVRASKGTIKIPGVECYSEDSTSVKTN